MTFRRRIMLALGLGVLLAAWFVSNSGKRAVPSEHFAFPSSAGALVGASAQAEANTPPNRSVLPAKTVSDAVPQQLKRNRLEAAARDPFSLEAATVAPAPQKPASATSAPASQRAPPPLPPPVMAAPVPSPPQLNLRFMGRMTNPDGQQVIFATLAESPVTLSVGQELANGYRVDSITDRAVQLSYPVLGTTARLDLPEPPKYEIR